MVQRVKGVKNVRNDMRLKGQLHSQPYVLEINFFRKRIRSMKLKTLIAAGLISLTSVAHAEPAFFAGISYLFDEADRGSLGFTVKALASDRTDRPSAAVGFTVYPGASSRYGIDLGVGYQNADAAGLVSYDLLLDRFSMSLGYADLRND
ncbi:MAG: hypothetical protein RL258_710 [Pseudomonadota bacterium]